MNLNQKINVFIMAGGSGTRLAPLSLNMPGKLPKQFLSLVGDKTLLQNAILRLPENVNILVIPEKKYETEVLNQSNKINKKITSLSEPFGCNTAAAILLGTFQTLNKYGEDAVLFFMPADSMMDDNTFRILFNKATKVAFDQEKIVTIGITPTRPEIGYGYICVDDSTDLTKKDYKKVHEFVEKPDLKTAENYFKSGKYYWNAGIFAFKVKTMISAMKKDAPIIYNALLEIKDDLTLDNIAKQYTLIKDKKENISIDFAVMEKESKNILLVPAPKELKWNDVGGWIALEEYLDKDDNGNVYSRKINIKNSFNNTIISYNDIQIFLENCENILVVETSNGIFITKKEFSSRAKEIIPGIEAKKNHEEIDCKNVVIENSTKLYLGVIALEDLKISFDGKALSILKNKNNI